MSTLPRLTLMLISGLLLAATSAFAQTAPSEGTPPTPSDRMEQRVDQRQDRQSDRIASGAESGQLTRREQARLQRQQAGTARMENRAEADGRITRREARHLEHRQDHASRQIARQKHDAQRPRP